MLVRRIFCGAMKQDWCCVSISYVYDVTNDVNYMTYVFGSEGSTFIIAFLQQCALRSQDLLFTIQNTLELKIRTGADPHLVRIWYEKCHVCSTQFSVCGIFPDSCKNSIIYYHLTANVKLH